MKITSYKREDSRFERSRLREELSNLLKEFHLTWVQLSIQKDGKEVFSCYAPSHKPLNPALFDDVTSKDNQRNGRVEEINVETSNHTTIGKFITELNLEFLVSFKRKKRLFQTRKTLDTSVIDRLACLLSLTFNEQAESTIQFREKLLPHLNNLDTSNLQRPLEILLAALDCNIGTLWQYHPAIVGGEQPNMLTLIAAGGKHHLDNYTRTCLPEGDGIVWHPLKDQQEGDIIFISDVTKQDLANEATFEDYGNQNLALIKLNRGSKIIGVICLVGAEPETINRRIRHLKIFQEFSAVLIQQIVSGRRERILNSLPKIIPIGNYDVQTLSDLCVKATRELVNAKGASIFLRKGLNVESNEFKLMSVDVSAKATTSTKTSNFINSGKKVSYTLKEKSLSSKVIRDCQPLVCHSISTHPLNSKTYRECEDYEFDSWIGVPLENSDGYVIGILRCTGKIYSIGNKEFHYVFNDFDLFILKYISDLFTKFLDTVNAFRQLQQLTNRLELADKIRTHEIAAPLASISANASFVLKYLFDSSATSKERRLGEIMSDSDICAFLIRETKVPSKESFRKGLNYTSVASLLTEVKKFLERQISARDKIEIYDDISGSNELRKVFRKFMKIRLMGSAPKTMLHKYSLQRTFYNLGVNAVKYGKFNGELIIKISEDSETESIFIDFIDDGIGVPEKDSEVIFDEGERGTNIQDYPGEGLGLSLSRSILEMHGGDLLLIQNQDPTIFRCILPILHIESFNTIEGIHPSISYADPPKSRF